MFTTLFCTTALFFCTDIYAIKNNPPDPSGRDNSRRSEDAPSNDEAPKQLPKRLAHLETVFDSISSGQIESAKIALIRYERLLNIQRYYGITGMKVVQLVDLAYEFYAYNMAKDPSQKEFILNIIADHLDEKLTVIVCENDYESNRELCSSRF